MVGKQKVGLLGFEFGGSLDRNLSDGGTKLSAHRGLKKLLC